MNTDRKLPEIDFPCPKCGDVRAYGPEYRRGADDGLGEHLRLYCCTCRYMTLQPTHDQNTPERQAELDAAFKERMSRPRPQPEVAAKREPQQVFKGPTARSQGWRD